MSNMIRYYLAIVDNDFQINDEIKRYFADKNVTLVQHFKSIGVLKISADYDLLETELQYIKHLELDSVVYTAILSDR